MPNTSNFNWPTPADTDLVKDGAAAIRNLGDGVDNSLEDLLGGTTGQVLTKASNTDLDFSFTTPSGSPLTTKGDLFTFSTVDARLPVGANGTILTADSSEATGLKFAAPAGGGLQVVVAQTTFTASSSVTVDNCFTSSHRNYQIVCNYTTSGGGGVRFRVRAAGSSISTSTYNHQLFDSKSTTNAGARTAADSSLVLGFGSGGTFQSSFNAIIYNPQIATPTTYFSQCSQQDGALNAPIVALASGNQTGATAFDGFELINSATMTGNFTVYGLGISL